MLAVSQPQEGHFLECRNFHQDLAQHLYPSLWSRGERHSTTSGKGAIDVLVQQLERVQGTIAAGPGAV